MNTEAWAGKGRYLRIKGIGSLALLVLSLSGGFIACKKEKPHPPAPPEVLVVTVKPRDTPVFKEWIGTLDGLVNAQIRAQVTGYLQTQDYKEGTQVKKGSLLFEIDPRPFEAALEQAKSKLAQDQAQESRTRWNVDRYAPLAKHNAISEQEYNDAVQANLSAQAQVKADEAMVQAADLNLSFTKIISPIDGLAGIAQAQIGDLVGPGGPLLTTVSTIDPMKVYFTTSEQAYLTYRRQYTNVTERATVFSNHASGNFSVVPVQWPSTPDPDRYLQWLFVRPKGVSDSKETEPIRQMMEEGRRIIDPEKRGQKYRELSTRSRTSTAPGSNDRCTAAATWASSATPI